jgi:hypothetical protein
MHSRRSIMSTISCAVLGLLLLGDAAWAATPAEALKAECNCEFDKTPLKDITEFVSNVHQVPVKLDAGVDGKSPVTIKHKGTLKEMLEKALPSLGLEYASDAKEIVIRKKKTEKK